MSPTKRAGDRSPGPTALIVTGDGSRTLLSRRYGESYGSRHGALTEARHVFLEASGVAARLAARQATTVVEVGFGTGLNALLTLDAAAAAGAPVRYLALERALVPARTLHALRYRELLQHPSLADALVAWRRALAPGACGCVSVPLGSALLELELVLGEARTAPLPDGVHAVYHDAFSPATNPEPWEAAFLRRLYGALTPGGTLVTYTVQGALRRRLAATGFRVARVPGPPGGKRQVLVATRPSHREAP